MSNLQALSLKRQTLSTSYLAHQHLLFFCRDFATMTSGIFLLLFCGIISEHLGNAQKLSKEKKKLNMKVHINATGDTLVMKFLRPHQNTRLEGFILGYGSNFFSNQYIQWPENGKSYITEVDAEPRYLISVKPNENKKSCKEKNSAQKPLQLVIGTLTPTSVFLSWGILINPQIDWSVLNKCPNDRFYTVRYKEKNKDWLFQLCPTTETVIDNLKPNTLYEFGVKDNTDGGIWSNSFNHKTISKGKENGQIQNTYKIPKGVIQLPPENTKVYIPITVIKQGFQNLTNLLKPKASVAVSPTEQNPVRKEEPKKVPAATTTKAPTPKPKLVMKVTEPPPAVKPSEKPSAEDFKPVPVETKKSSTLAPKTTISTESPSPELDQKTPHRMPINLIRVHFFDEQSTVPDITGKLRETTDSPPPKDDRKPPHRMPINVIRVHFFEDPEQSTTKVPYISETVIPTKRWKTTESPLLTDAASKTHTTLPPTPKTNQSSKKSITKPVVHTTQKPPHQKTTLRPESPDTKPVPIQTQKVSPPKTKKPQQTPRPRAKPAPTGPPQVSIKPVIPHQIREATLAPYRVHPSSSRPRTSVRPRTRPAQNGTAPRARPTGDNTWMTGVIPGGRYIDSTKLLGASRNISMEPNNTGKRVFSVSSAPLIPVRPTSVRRRFPPTNVTGRPGGPGSVLLPVVPSTAKPNRTTPAKQPTYPPEDDIVDTTVFSPSPKSDIDALGKTRYTATHVKYMSKDEKIPCSITESLRHFPTEEASNQEATVPPQNPPSNLTVVTVEGCSSFVILDWEPNDNDTVTEYEVISKENGAPPGKDQSITTTNQTHSTVENLKPDTSYEFHVIPKNPLGDGPVSNTVEFNTESADPRVSEPVKAGKDAIWTEIKFKSDSYSECRGKQYVKRTWYKKFVGIQLCNSLRYKIYLSDSLSGTFYNIGDQSGFGEDHCQFVDSFLDGRTGQQLLPEQLTSRKGFYRSVRQQPVDFGNIGGNTHISYVHWYECGIAIPGKW
ncbi:target of Nesh-SH3 isoform X11 [Pelobates cultripes]|uniref:Target of Nesh-SH3 isoform X11 n=1 Tax=Pelobates cultripes TaxID=61616 RepID=A0AAD1R4F1_PELCU|nr:target of Nesh-SH3 isoform X11 [Pelobates cultripes]